METQLALAVSVGLISFFTFCLLRTRSRVLYAPRTLLKGEVARGEVLQLTAVQG